MGDQTKGSFAVAESRSGVCVSARRVHVLRTRRVDARAQLSDKIEYRAQISGVLVKQAVALVRIQ